MILVYFRYYYFLTIAVSVAKKPTPSRPQWLSTILIITLLLFFGIRHATDPNRTEREAFATAEQVPLSQITKGYTDKEFKKILIEGNKIFAVPLNESGAYLQSYRGGESIADLGWNDPANTTVVEIKNQESSTLLLEFIYNLLPIVLIIGGLFWLFKGISRSQNNALSFGKSKARITDFRQVKTRFKDVAGIAEAKEDLIEVVDFLKNPKKYSAIGAKIPKGVLLVGAPGTGKTLLARAVAGEAGVPFFSIAGSEFVEMFVGVGASRVRDLFNRAKRNAPCIIFIDEIDAVGRQRGGAGFGGGHDEREQTLNQILTEMDGFEQGTNIIVIAATNRPDVLDKALLRPGRFDRRVFIEKPDLDAREQILAVHARNKKMSSSINLRDIAKQTVGLSGADLENIMNEAAIIAAKAKKKSVAQADLVEAVEKVTIGAAKKSRKLTTKETEITSYHELGHAIVGHLCEYSDPLHKISIVSRGSALGVTWFLPKEDQYTTSKSKFLDEICGLLAGRAAEEIVFGEITTGASNDIERASQIARNMAMRYGMAEEDLGLVAYGENQSGFTGADVHSNKNYSDEMAKKIDEFVRTTIATQYKRAFKILEKHRAKLDELHVVLMKKETMSVEEFIAIFEEKASAKPAKRSASKKA
jgi:cell division protease FtsH